MSDESLVNYSVDGHVATIQLNRPKAMNALNHDLRMAIRAAQADAEANKAVRVIVLTGSGNSFTSGTDLKELGDFVTKKGMFDISVRDYKPILDGITKSDKIYVAAINGVAGGVGLSIALSCDLAVMAESATCFAPFTNIGLVPDGGLSWLLLQHMGSKRAFAAIAEAEHITAATCLEMGIVNKVTADDTVLMDAQSWAASLADRAPLSLAFSKRIMREAHMQSHDQIALLESEYQMKCANSEDSGNAITAFFTKQKPVFKGL
ncbi:2-(1,2-epoxy-1,2-dihydrophenyl)acetyl-CoA isomerase [Shimia gijangensis]|uniref:2-(1,2-epoxy-1,2-dihydrophenyl)acetyl-CoA isomerase n=1 Tax=Shimia gijangensis TaxID=1470563 RepID=A0A1M6MCZ0_9RHOB|nr:enoyl-CoA hydratase/isomerase family protein [Shimia gijangensis]SHJ81269.1 2-(1,2-epoxy-1,2-dihydrophenyl)acetyl-CoA isomerase [Shimia gijangensis]